ncbi:hypothetical protein vseg_013516 [Gypsophila vaccaria]
MARKSNMQKQSELNLRGLNVMRTTTTNDQQDMELRDGEEQTELCPNGQTKGPNEDSLGKMKDINEIIGITELIVENDYEEEEDVRDTVTGEAKQSNASENRANGTELGNAEAMLQLEQDDVNEEIEYWKNAVVCFILGANPHGKWLKGS